MQIEDCGAWFHLALYEKDYRYTRFTIFKEQFVSNVLCHIKNANGRYFSIAYYVNSKRRAYFEKYDMFHYNYKEYGETILKTNNLYNFDLLKDWLNNCFENAY